MTIKEENFIIQEVLGNYTLYIKNKRNKYSVKGYFTSMESCLKRLASLKLIDVKYYNELKELKITLKSYSKSIYKPIKQLNKEVNGF